MINVVSFSGGRTSAYLVHLMEEKRKKEGWEVAYIFMDTGAEHPKTYEFIRNIVKEWGINLICLRVVFNPELGKGNSYQELSVDEIGYDLTVWREMLKKYSTPYNPGGGFCTKAMKTLQYNQYCDEHYGKENYTTWLGMRADEPKRLTYQKRVKYLADISDFDKDDILDWWDDQPFNLDLQEYLGNCVFCIKKGVNKVALAAKDEPEMAKEFMDIVESPNVRIIEKRKAGPLQMYRGKLSLRQVIAAYEDVERDELFWSLRSSKRYESGSCSESCEIFNDDQLDLWG